MIIYIILSYVSLIFLSVSCLYFLYRSYVDLQTGSYKDDNIHHDWRPSSFYSISNRKHKEGE